MGKVKDFNLDLKKISSEDLNKKIEELRRTKFSLQLASANAHIKDVSQFKKLKKSLARALTVLREKELEA